MEEQSNNVGINEPKEALPEVPTVFAPQPTPVDSPSPEVASADVPSTETYREEVAEQRSGAVLEWQASEYDEREKSAVWFVVLGIVTLGLLALAIFVLKEYTFAALILVMAVAVVVWARRPATNVQYQLSATSVVINGKIFPLHSFRAFGVVQQAEISSIVLLPIKRFVPGVNVHFPHELGEQIVDVLGAVLAMEDVKPDFIDKLTNHLNF